MFLRDGGSEDLGQPFRAIFTTNSSSIAKPRMDLVLFARQGKDDDEINENQDEENEDAPFWTDRTNRS